MKLQIFFTMCVFISLAHGRLDDREEQITQRYGVELGARTNETLGTVMKLYQKNRLLIIVIYKNAQSVSEVYAKQDFFFGSSSLTFNDEERKQFLEANARGSKWVTDKEAWFHHMRRDGKAIAYTGGGMVMISSIDYLKNVIKGKANSLKSFL